MNVLGGTGWRWVAAGLVSIGVGLLLVGLSTGLRPVASAGMAALAFGGLAIFCAIWPRCARCYGALFETTLLFPIDQIEGIRRDLWNATADTLSQPHLVDLARDRIAIVRGKFCPTCGAVALVTLGELHSSGRFAMATGPGHEDETDFIEVTGLAALAIRRLALHENGQVN